ncbi:MAG: ATP--guanido phosphotransferase, partial [Clostridia bacterium]|nr:ATP--guanido phosphotransferase [Clostridia bacterium]
MRDKWYQKSGNGNDLFVSTRIRLARNLRGYPFPSSMTDEQRADLEKRVIEAVEQIGGLNLRVIALASCEKREVLAM